MSSRGSVSSISSASSGRSSAGAAHTITEECERLFCGTLGAVFLGEGNSGAQDPLLMGALEWDGADAVLPISPPESPVGGKEAPASVSQHVEIWTYASGLRFRGFVADKDGARSLFVFFDKEVIDKDLKKGYVCGHICTLT